MSIQQYQQSLLALRSYSVIRIQDNTYIWSVTIKIICLPRSIITLCSTVIHSVRKSYLVSEMVFNRQFYKHYYDQKWEFLIRKMKSKNLFYKRQKALCQKSEYSQLLYNIENQARNSLNIGKTRLRSIHQQDQ